MKSRFIPVFMLAVFLIGFGPVRAGTEVRFTSRELDAAYVLVRPELNVIELDGRSGVFSPAPALRFFGLHDQRFEIDFNSIIDLVDLRFNHLRARSPEVKFTGQSLELSLSVDDQEKVLKSRLGAVSIEGVSLVAVLNWQTYQDGSQSLVLQGVRFNGVLKGTGLLKSTWVLEKLKGLFVKTMSDQIRQILKRPLVQDSILDGLLSWAKFYTGEGGWNLNPGSIRFFKADAVSGVRFEVQ